MLLGLLEDAVIQQDAGELFFCMTLVHSPKRVCVALNELPPVKCLALAVMPAMKRSMSREFHACFIDLSKVVDSVDRPLAWEHFTCLGFPATGLKGPT